MNKTRYIGLGFVEHPYSPNLVPSGYFLNCKKNKHVMGVLFVCIVTKAVHIKLVSSLSIVEVETLRLYAYSNIGFWKSQKIAW